jgi:hypothetical protein
VQGDGRARSRRGMPLSLMEDEARTTTGVYRSAPGPGPPPLFRSERGNQRYSPGALSVFGKEKENAYAIALLKSIDLVFSTRDFHHIPVSNERQPLQQLSDLSSRWIPFTLGAKHQVAAGNTSTDQ